MLDEKRWKDLKARLARSKFRSRFRLREKESVYLHSKGMPVIQEHA
ncbi:MAG: DUF4186 family protein, partial [Candidatus Aureabacteria bacterium]|nr:DUF4186 family protein [Candidatus Auribacterota bacterium]